MLGEPEHGISALQERISHCWDRCWPGQTTKYAGMVCTVLARCVVVLPERGHLANGIEAPQSMQMGDAVFTKFAPVFLGEETHSVGAEAR